MNRDPEGVKTSTKIILRFAQKREDYVTEYMLLYPMKLGQ
jgi:hypothetical protein